MKHDSTLFSAIAMNDSQAMEVFSVRFAAPLFRFCRLNFTDHFRTGEFVEETLAKWIRRIRNGDIKPSGLADMFLEAHRASGNQWRGERGRGLSGKQRRILEMMEELPILERLALDLWWLEEHDLPQVCGWLDVDPDRVESCGTAFLQKLSSDNTIKELLQHAAIHQSRQKSAEKRIGQAQTGSTPFRREKQDTFRQNRPGWNERDHTRDRSGSIPEKAADSRGESFRDQSKDPGTDADGRHKATPEEREKSRARRRRVDPRELDFKL